MCMCTLPSVVNWTEVCKVPTSTFLLNLAMNVAHALLLSSLPVIIISWRIYNYIMQ